MKRLFILCLSFLPLISFAQETDIYHAADSLYTAQNWKAATAAYKESMRSDDKDAAAWYHLGVAYHRQLQYREAIEAYQKSLELKSAVIPQVYIRANLSKAYAANRDSANALQVLSDMETKGYYGNFPDIDSASEYQWLKNTPHFKKLLADAKNYAYPCAENPQNRVFDFWVGQWMVYRTGTHFQVGTSLIQKVTGGCTILENWTAYGYPNDGKSMNFIQPKTNKWEQVWMGSAGGYQNYYNGEYRDGAMRYDGDSKDAKGNKLLMHLTYFNQSPDRVRQLLESSADEGKTWSTNYDFTYERVK